MLVIIILVRPTFGNDHMEKITESDQNTVCKMQNIWRKINNTKQNVFSSYMRRPIASFVLSIYSSLHYRYSLRLGMEAANSFHGIGVQCAGVLCPLRLQCNGALDSMCPCIGIMGNGRSPVTPSNM